MNHILSKRDINWIYSLIINNNIVKDNKHDLKKDEINIYEEIKYGNNFNLIKRV